MKFLKWLKSLFNKIEEPPPGDVKAEVGEVRVVSPERRDQTYFDSKSEWKGPSASWKTEDDLRHDDADGELIPPYEIPKLPPEESHLGGSSPN